MLVEVETEHDTTPKVRLLASLQLTDTSLFAQASIVVLGAAPEFRGKHKGFPTFSFATRPFGLLLDCVDPENFKYTLTSKEVTAA
jgi:hypothetical protein